MHNAKNNSTRTCMYNDEEMYMIVIDQIVTFNMDTLPSLRCTNYTSKKIRDVHIFLSLWHVECLQVTTVVSIRWGSHQTHH